MYLKLLCMCVWYETYSMFNFCPYTYSVFPVPLVEILFFAHRVAFGSIKKKKSTHTKTCSVWPYIWALYSLLSFQPYFLKYFVGIYFDDHISSSFINTVNFINWFSNDKPISHYWFQHHLDIIYNHVYIDAFDLLIFD